VSADRIDVTEIARDVGFRIPVFIHEDAWKSCVYSDAGKPHEEMSRLWDLLQYVHNTFRKATALPIEFHFQLMKETYVSYPLNVQILPTNYPPRSSCLLISLKETGVEDNQ